MPIILKSDDEIAIMREAGRIVGQTLCNLVGELRPGLVVKELDKTVRREFERHKVVPTFLGYPPGAAVPYPATVCVSVNEEIVHGIPGKRVLQEGDVVSIDLGCTHKGFVADSAVTAIVGRPRPGGEELVETTREALNEGIRHARAGNRLGEISHAIQCYVESRGFGVVREYVGHGVGREMHEEPQVPNFGKRDRGERLSEGMVLAIEPMVNAGTPDVVIKSDGWTAVTRDGRRSAHFEHSVAVTPDGPYVLSQP